MKLFDYFRRLYCNVACCSVRIQRINAIVRCKWVDVCGLSKFGATVFVQTANLMTTPFGRGRKSCEFHLLILLPAPPVVGNPNEVLERQNFKNCYVVGAQTAY
jgi:hypothetical protein